MKEASLEYVIYRAYVSKHLVFGESVWKAHRQKVYLVIIPMDLSKRHQEDVIYRLEQLHIPYRLLSDLATLKRLTNRDLISFIGITEKGLAESIIS